MDDNQGSTLTLTFDCLDGDISFFVKVSSESGFDKLSFRIDGTVVGQWSGETEWTGVSYPVLAGHHVFEWEYAKDASGFDGADKAWIDDIAFSYENWTPVSEAQ